MGPGCATACSLQAIRQVIDYSGSVDGRSLIDVRQYAELMVSRLRPTDTVSLVQFNNRALRLRPAVPMRDGAPVGEARSRTAANICCNLAVSVTTHRHALALRDPS